MTARDPWPIDRTHGAPSIPPPAITDHATCPGCGRGDCAVRSCYRQATRYEPRRFLGRSGYCPTCLSGFAVTTSQTVLAHA